MVWKDDNRFNCERMSASYFPERTPQQSDVLSKQSMAAVRKIQGKKETAARKEISSVISHGG